MPLLHILLALLVVVVWGCNFIFIKFGLQEIPPLFFCFLRFLFASIPAIFFIKPPAAPFKTIFLYGLIMFGLQFSLLFISMKVGMPPGMASLLIQIQVFFSIFFAVVFLRETPGIWQVIGACVSFIGIGLIAMHLDNNITLIGFILIIAAAATWGVGNLITKKLTNVNTLSLVVWGSFAACFPLLILSLLFEGPRSIENSYHHITWSGVISVLYVVYFSTWVGYGVWNWLINRYPVSTIVPFTLLIPIIGILSSILVFKEPFQLWKLFAGILVITGLCINLVGARFLMKGSNLSVKEAN